MQPDVYRHAWFLAGAPINTQFVAGTPYGVQLASVEGLDASSDISENRLVGSDGTDIVGASAFTARTITLSGTMAVYDPTLNGSLAGIAPVGYIPTLDGQQTLDQAIVADQAFAHWKFNGASTAQQDVIAGKVLTAGASVLLQQPGATLDGDTAVDCGTGATAAYQLAMSSDDGAFDTNVFSFGIWFKPTGVGGGVNRAIASKMGANYGWEIYYTSAGAVVFATKQATVVSSMSVAAGIANGTWYYIAISHDGTRKNVGINGPSGFSNGNFGSSVAYTNASNDGILTINAGSTAGNNGACAYDEAEFYTTVALTQAQMLARYTTGTTAKGPVKNNLSAAKAHFERLWSQYVGATAEEQVLQYPRDDAPDAPLSWLTQGAYNALATDEAAALLGQAVHFAGIDYARCMVRPVTRLTWGAMVSPYEQEWTIGLKCSSGQIAIDNGILAYSNFTGEVATTVPTPRATSPGYALLVSGRGGYEASVVNPGTNVIQYAASGGPVVSLTSQQDAGLPATTVQSGESQAAASRVLIDTMREKNGLRIVKKGLFASAMNDPSLIFYVPGCSGLASDYMLNATYTGNPAMAAQKLATINFTKVGTWGAQAALSGALTDTLVCTTAGTPSLKWAPASYVLNPPYIVRATYSRWDSNQARVFGVANLMQIIGVGGTINPFSINAAGDVLVFGQAPPQPIAHIMQLCSSAANPVQVTMTCLVTATNVYAFLDVIQGSQPAPNNGIYSYWKSASATLPGAFTSVQLLTPTIAGAGDGFGGWAECAIFDGTIAPAQKTPLYVNVRGANFDSWMAYPFAAYASGDGAIMQCDVDTSQINGTLSQGSASTSASGNRGQFLRARVLERIA